MEMNEIEKQAYDLVYEEEFGNFNTVTLHFNLCFLYSAITFFLVIFFEKNIKNIFAIIFLNVALYSLPYIQKMIKTYELKDNEEYQLAKQILKKYEEKVKKEDLKIELEETFEKEQRKSDKIKEFQKYLNEDNEKQ